MKAECHSYLNVLCSSSDGSCTKSQAPVLGNKGRLVMLDDEAKLVEVGLTTEQVVGIKETRGTHCTEGGTKSNLV